jgi:hypothetical protein
MAPIDPWPAHADDTDCDYYDTPSGNIWCPDQPGTATAEVGVAGDPACRAADGAGVGSPARHPNRGGGPGTAKTPVPG